MWFIYALITLLFWALADLFYKKGANENDKYSHLKTGIMVGEKVVELGMMLIINYFHQE